MAVLLALSTAITYGFADFNGGLASRRADPMAVTASAQGVGLLLSPLAILLVGGNPGGLLVAMGAGVLGGLGLLLYFTAMRDGAMGVVSPLSAAAAAGVPVAVGLSLGERPSWIALVGVAIALPAIWLAARPSPAPPTPAVRRAEGPAVVQATQHPAETLVDRIPPGVVLGLLSGVAFGLFFVLLDLTPDDSGAWPLLGSKIGSFSVVTALAVGRRRSPIPARPAWRLVAVSGALDMVANLLFLLATREGLLTLVSAISAQYPVVVVILSVVVLREALGRSQRLGIVLALIAVGLISLG